jgi:hypothetical protein
MRFYTARRIPRGTHVRQFWLLTHDEQRDKVRKLVASGMSRGAVSQLTGLSLPDIAGMLEGAQ